MASKMTRRNFVHKETALAQVYLNAFEADQGSILLSDENPA